MEDFHSKWQLLPRTSWSVGCHGQESCFSLYSLSFPVLKPSQKWPQVFHEQSRSALVLFQSSCRECVQDSMCWEPSPLIPAHPLSWGGISRALKLQGWGWCEHWDRALWHWAALPAWLINDFPLEIIPVAFCSPAIPDN